MMAATDARIVTAHDTISGIVIDAHYVGLLRGTRYRLAQQTAELERAARHEEVFHGGEWEHRGRLTDQQSALADMDQQIAAIEARLAATGPYTT